MAATIAPRGLARLLHLQGACDAVKRTDRENRLPTITSDEVDTIFDQMRRETLHIARAA